jgi:hypothetical protein
MISIACYYRLPTCHKLFNSGLVKTYWFAYAISSKTQTLSIQPNISNRVANFICVDILRAKVIFVAIYSTCIFVAVYVYICIYYHKVCTIHKISIFLTYRS